MVLQGDGWEAIDIATTWHKVTFETSQLTPECQEWLRLSMHGGFYIGFDDLFFEDSRDITTFKLRFG